MEMENKKGGKIGIIPALSRVFGAVARPDFAIAGGIYIAPPLFFLVPTLQRGNYDGVHAAKSINRTIPPALHCRRTHFSVVPQFIAECIYRAIYCPNLY